MKGPVRNPSTYQFNAAGKTLTFLAPIPTFQGQILGVFNITRQTWIYLPQKVGANGVSYTGTWSSPTLALAFDTTAHSNTDSLQVFYDDGLTAQAVAPDVEVGGGAITAKTQRFTLATDDSIATALGSDGTSPPTLPGSSTGIRGWLRYLASLLPANPATANNQQAANELLTESNSYLPFVVDYTGSTQARLGTTGTGAPTLPSGASGLAGLVQVFYQALLDRLPSALSGGRLLVAPSLPADAATATNQGATNTALASLLAKISAFGAAGTPSSDVLTVQGNASGTPLPVITNAGTNTSTAGLALEAGGNLATLVNRTPALIGNRTPVLWLPGAPIETSFTQSGAIALNTILLTLDCSNSAALSIETSSAGTGGAIVVEWSNSGVFYGPPTLLHQNVGTNTTTIATAGIVTAPKMGRFARLRQSVASTGGTTTLYVSQLPDCPALTTTSQLSASVAVAGAFTKQYSVAASVAGAATAFKVIAAAGTNATSIKPGAGRAIGFNVFNASAATAWLKFHNTNGTPTPGSGVIAPFGVAAGAPREWLIEGGWAHNVGIGITITAGPADSDTTPVAANAIVGVVYHL